MRERNEAYQQDEKVDSLHTQVDNLAKRVNEQTNRINKLPSKAPNVEKSLKTQMNEVQAKINLIRTSNIKGSEDFVNCLISWANDPKHELSLSQKRDVVQFVDKSCDLLLRLSAKPERSEIKDVPALLNKLKQDLPPTTFGRCILGFINALLVPLFAMLETVKLLGGDAEYRYTKNTARDCYYLFKSPVSPAIDLINEMYEIIEENKVEAQVNPDYKLV